MHHVGVLREEETDVPFRRRVLLSTLQPKSAHPAGSAGEGFAAAEDVVEAEMGGLEVVDDRVVEIDVVKDDSDDLAKEVPREVTDLGDEELAVAETCDVAPREDEVVDDALDDMLAADTIGEDTEDAVVRAALVDEPSLNEDEMVADVLDDTAEGDVEDVWLDDASWVDKVDERVDGEIFEVASDVDVENALIDLIVIEEDNDFIVVVEALDDEFGEPVRP
ncbi:hypothetical protein P7C73_g2883, partial [Tremellales sp. Uapishka_1]